MAGTFGFTWGRFAGGARPGLVHALHAEYPRAQRREPWRHPLWVIDCNFSDFGRVWLPHAEAWWPRTEPMVHVYAPGVRYLEELPKAPRRRTLRSAFVMVEGGEAAGLDALVAPGRGFARFTDAAGAARWLLHRIAEVGHVRHDRGRWQAQALLFELVDLFHNAERVDDVTGRITAGDRQAGTDDVPLVEAVDAFLADHVATPVTLRQIADHVGVSESTLSHRYRAQTGTTPIARLLQIRIALAKGMLLKGPPLKVIAAHTGFADAFHLSRTFKRLVGVSPRQYRAEHAGARASQGPQQQTGDSDALPVFRGDQSFS